MASYTDVSSAANGAAVSLLSDTAFAGGKTPRAIFVGTAGDVKVDLVKSGTGVVFKNMANGSLLTIQVSKIYSTANGTSASDIVTLW